MTGEDYIKLRTLNICSFKLGLMTAEQLQESEAMRAANKEDRRGAMKNYSNYSYFKESKYSTKIAVSKGKELM